MALYDPPPTTQPLPQLPQLPQPSRGIMASAGKLKICAFTFWLDA